MRSFHRNAVVLSILCMVVLFSTVVPASESVSMSLVGRVVDFGGQPVEGASVSFYENAANAREGRPGLHKLVETRSQSDGRFSLTAECHESLTWLIAYKDGLAIRWATQGVGPRNVTLILGRPQPLGGVIVDEAGQPVAGARVSLCLKNEMMDLDELFFPGQEDWLQRQTDGEGRFLFDNLPADTTADFQIEAPGRALFRTFRSFGLKPGEQYPVGRTDLRIVLPPEARIEGKVVDEDTGQAVSDVRVLARPHEQADRHYCPAPAIVDPNGRFVLTGLTSGSYKLQMLGPQGRTQCWFGHEPVITVQTGQTVSDVTLNVNRGATLEVLAFESDSDTGIQGIEVNAMCGSCEVKATTDANGLARLQVPAGSCSLSAIKPEYGGIQGKNLLLEKGQTCREILRITLMAVHAGGTVVDPQGHPVAGASVVHWPFWTTSSTDSDGRFEYKYYTNAASPRQTICVRDDSSGLASIAELSDPSGQRKPTGRITLQPAHSVTGYVVDPNGKGIPTAAVRLVVASPQRLPLRVSVLAEVATNIDGMYEIRAIPTPSSDFDAYYYAVVAYAAGYNEASVEPVPLDGPVEEPVRLKTIELLPADRTISGVVVDANDAPLPGVLVETPGIEGPYRREDAAQPHRRTLSDDQGRFRIAGACRGPVDITATTPSPDSRKGVTHTAGGESNVRIVPGQTLTFAKSLLGTRLPAWSELGLSAMTSELQGQSVLLCFVDLQQRPCRHALAQLAGQRDRLAARNVRLVAVQAAAGEIAEFQDWASKELGIGPVASPSSDFETLQRTWGFQSLPWLVLADDLGIVRAEGFAPSRIDAVLDKTTQTR